MMKIIMYSTRWCPDCFRAKAFFNKKGIKYTDININKDEQAALKVEELNNGFRSVPTIVFQTTSGEEHVLVEPSTIQLEEFLENHS